MFNDWENYYLIVGSLAGALIGVMFVVVTLTAGLDIGTRLSQSARTYITPVVFHFAVVVIASAIAAVPKITPPAAGAALAFVAAIGLGYSVLTTMRIFSADNLPNQPDLSDKILYGIVPSLIYLAFVVTSAAIWLGSEGAVYVVAALMLGLLLVGVRNAWDLATYIVQRTSDNKHTET